MNKKGEANRRVRQTRILIKKTFLQFMESKPYETISVKEIVKACDINRATFYYHYDNIDDLLNEIETELIEETLKPMQKISKETYVEGEHPFITEVYKSFQINKRVYKILLGENGDMRFLWKLFDEMAKYCRKKWIKTYEGKCPKNLDAYNYYMIGGELALLLYQQEKADKISTGELGYISGEFMAVTDKMLSKLFKESVTD
jgi:AcrR family transcriptional regulator